MRICATASLYLCLLAVAAEANEIPTPISTSQFTSAESGEVLVDTERGDMNRGQVIGFVRAPVADLIAIVIDSDNHEHWFPDTREARMLERSGDVGVSSGVTSVPVFRDRTWTLRGTHSAPRYSGVQCEMLEYEYVPGGGNMDDLFGYWLLCPRGEGTVVKYVINADLGMWLPGAVVTWAQNHMLPGVISGLQDRWNTLHP